MGQETGDTRVRLKREDDQTFGRTPTFGGCLERVWPGERRGGFGVVGMVGLIGADDSQNSNDEVEVEYRDSDCVYDSLDGVLSLLACDGNDVRVDARPLNMAAASTRLYV